jgi:hypothetical protein
VSEAAITSSLVEDIVFVSPTASATVRAQEERQSQLRQAVSQSLSLSAFLTFPSRSITRVCPSMIHLLNFPSKAFPVHFLQEILRSAHNAREAPPTIFSVYSPVFALARASCHVASLLLLATGNLTSHLLVLVQRATCADQCDVV